MEAKAKSRRTGGETARLGPQAWIDAALRILEEQGIEAVRVEPLAKELGITKGSFYWHFKDRPALLEAILTHWRRHATLDIIARLDKNAGDARSRLSQLLRIPFHGPRALRSADVELAVRLWGRQDAKAREALEEVDQLRLRYIRGLLEEAGLGAETAAVRAVYCYSFMRVAGTLIDHTDEAMIDRCVDLVLKP